MIADREHAEAHAAEAEMVADVATRTARDNATTPWHDVESPSGNQFHVQLNYVAVDVLVDLGWTVKHAQLQF